MPSVPPRGDAFWAAAKWADRPNLGRLEQLTCTTRGRARGGTDSALVRAAMKLASLAILAALLPLSACAAPTAESDAEQATSDLGTDPTIPELPWAGGTGDLSPWGGAD